MILHKRHIKKLLTELNEGIGFGADTVICAEGLVKPNEIVIRNCDVALPLPFLADNDEAEGLQSYDANIVQSTLLMISSGKLPAYLEKIGKVDDNSKLVNVGAIVTRRAADKRLRRNRTAANRQLPGKPAKGRRR